MIIVSGLGDQDASAKILDGVKELGSNGRRMRSIFNAVSPLHSVSGIATWYKSTCLLCKEASHPHPHPPPPPPAPPSLELPSLSPSICLAIISR